MWNEAGYFDNSAEDKPLLHLWSLGIEEQFYVVWPLLLWFAWKRKFNLLTITAVVAVATFILNLKGVKQDIIATFYSPQTRFWELLSGSLLAWFALYKKDAFANTESRIDGWISCIVYREKQDSDGKTFANVLSFVGLFLLLYGFWSINKELSFPGKWALVPVLGTVLVITAGSKAWVNRTILSNRVAVWFGLISFPLYLWHWPLLSFGRVLFGDGLNWYFKLCIVMLSVALAWATFFFIEKPIRWTSPSSFRVVVLSILMCLVGLLGYCVYVSDGFKFRFSGSSKLLQELAQFTYDPIQDFRVGSCLIDPRKDDYSTFSNCTTEGSKSERSIILWGDSHAAALYQGYKSSFGDSYALIQRTASSCPPLLDDMNMTDRSKNSSEGEGDRCRYINEGVFSLIKMTVPSRVVVHANWTNYDLTKLDQTIDFLKKIGIKNIDLIGPVPLWRSEGLPRLLYLHYEKFIPHVIPYKMDYGLDPIFLTVDASMRQKALDLGINYISPKSYLCDQDGCITRLGDTSASIIAFDKSHLTKSGSQFLVAKFPRY